MVLSGRIDKVSEQNSQLKVLVEDFCSDLKLDKTNLSNLISKHNNLCKIVTSQYNSNSSSIDELIVHQNNIVQKLSEIEGKVNYVMSHWENEWDDGNSWKNGMRPDGSSTDEEDNT